MLKLYNSLGRKVQTFKPIRSGEVRIYNCGPTVWNFAGVHNFRTFISNDLLRRYLEYKGYKVTQVMNITDVEDRIIRGIKDTHKSLNELTDFYESAFFEDLATLRSRKAEYYPRATSNMTEIVSLIRLLTEKGYAYPVGDGSVYFSVGKFKRYGALSGVKLKGQRSAGRVSSDHYEEKREAADFALWKAWDPDDGEVFWDTEFGKGRPGWHIECSAMALKYLGKSFDIHTGGEDLRFPHHENEIAQSEAATGRKFVNYWVHTAFLTYKGEEMHKSVGNVVYLKDLVKAGWDPATVRLFLISSKYRDPMDLTDSGLEQARAQRTRLLEFIARLKSVREDHRKNSDVHRGMLKDFERAMDEDLNTPKALAVIFAFVKKVNVLIDSGALSAEGAAQTIKALERVNTVLGVLDFGEEDLPPELSALVASREEARRRKDFAESDRLRNELLNLGVIVEDTPEGPRWKRLRKG